MANRTPTRARSFAALIAILALMTLSLGSALAHDSTRDTTRNAAPAGGGLTTNVGVLTNDGHVDESSEQETVDESTDETEVDENDQGQSSVDENDQGQDEQADENDQNDQADDSDDSGNDEAENGDSGGGDESDDGGGEGGDD